MRGDTFGGNSIEGVGAPPASALPTRHATQGLASGLYWGPNGGTFGGHMADLSLNPSGGQADTETQSPRPGHMLLWPKAPFKSLCWCGPKSPGKVRMPWHSKGLQITLQGPPGEMQFSATQPVYPGVQLCKPDRLCVAFCGRR